MPGLPRHRWVFLAAFLLGGAGVLGPIAGEPARQQGATERTAPSAAFVERHRLSDSVWVAAQLEPGDLAAARAQGFRTVIALRPDGEAPGQADAATMRVFAGEAGLGFAYVPVPQGDLPDAVADDLGLALVAADGPVLLYCRSGRRAARAWSVAEASRSGGLSVEGIRAVAAAAGHPVDDLADRLAQRAGQRDPSTRG